MLLLVISKLVMVVFLCSALASSIQPASRILLEDISRLTSLQVSLRMYLHKNTIPSIDISFLSIVLVSVE
jgi:hypothetical protein